MVAGWKPTGTSRFELKSAGGNRLNSAGNCMINLISLRTQLRLWLCVCVMIASVAVRASENLSNSEVLTLADMQQLVSKHGRVIQSFRLEGVVCAVVLKQRLVALQDDSATVLLELPALDAGVSVGDRLVIEGENCSLIRGDYFVQIGTAPVVDADGHHVALLKSGKVYLPAGLQPIHLAWFNRFNLAVLKLEWEGPGLRRQKVSDSALWRESSGGLKQGLDFLAYNGDGSFLADFEKLMPVKQGVATNFDLSYRVRPEHTALFFNGCIMTPRAGIYTFYRTSDDGAQLRVGEPSVICTRIPARSCSCSRNPDSEPSVGATERFLVGTVEGEVAFAGASREHLDFELMAEGDRIPVKVIAGEPLLATNRFT